MATIKTVILFSTRNINLKCDKSLPLFVVIISLLPRALKIDETVFLYCAIIYISCIMCTRAGIMKILGGQVKLVPSRSH